MKYSTVAAMTVALGAVASVHAAAIPQPEALAARGEGAPLKARLVTTHNDPHNTNSDPKYGDSNPVTNTTSTNTYTQLTNQSDMGNDKSQTNGNGNYWSGGAPGSGGVQAGGPRCGSKRSLAWRRAFAARDSGAQASAQAGDDKQKQAEEKQKQAQQKQAEKQQANNNGNNSGNTNFSASSSSSDSHADQSHGSHNDDHSDNSKNSHNDNSKYIGGNIGGQSNVNASGSNGGGNSNTCVNLKREFDEHEAGLAVLRSLGAMTERHVEDPLEALAARDIGYAASVLGVRAYESDDFEGAMARRDGGDFALRCVDGAECSAQMRREAEELLTMHARDLGFHF